MDEKCIIDPERDCIGKAAAALLEKRIEDLEAWQQDSKKFHNDFYDWQRTQIARDAKLEEQLSNMNKNIEKVLKTQEACAMKPAKRWNDMVDRVIWSVLAAVIAFILAKFGL